MPSHSDQIRALFESVNTQLSQRGCPLLYRSVEHMYHAWCKSTGEDGWPRVPPGTRGYDQATELKILTVLLQYKINQHMTSLTEAHNDDD